MDLGQSLIIPHLFDGTNYAYWKVRIRAFLQYLDEKLWLAIEVGWKKPEELWTQGRSRHLVIWSKNHEYSVLSRKEL